MDYLSTTVEDGMESAKLPHREALSVRHNKGRGVRPPDFCHPCTELGKNVLCSPLQGVCPCGCLAKGVAFREKLQSTAPAQPDCRNPKIAERSDVPLRDLEGLSRRSARQNCLAERVNMP